MNNLAIQSFRSENLRRYEHGAAMPLEIFPSFSSITTLRAYTKVICNKVVHSEAKCRVHCPSSW